MDKGNFERRSFNDRGRNMEQRETHQATCSGCGASCDVPFKPTPGRDVFCRDCYRKRKPAY